MIDISVIIISYNTAQMTCAAIESVFEQTRKSTFELIVVDNNSEDRSADLIAEKFPHVNLIRLRSNIGFAAANNLAAKKAQGKYILLLNPDTLVLNSAIDKLVQFAETNPEYSVYGGATLFSNMTRNPTAGWNMATRWSLLSTALGFSSLFRFSKFFSPESLAWWNWNGPREVDIVTGCFFLLRTEVWNALEGFDCEFYMYGEDADLCLRAASLGKRCILYPEAEIIHYGGASERVRADKMSRVLKAKSQLFIKHWKRGNAGYAVAMLKLWSITRTIAFRIIYPFHPKKREAYEAWHEVWKRRLEWGGGFE